MRKVCYYSSAADYGGAEVYLECLMQGAKAKGLDVVLILDRNNDKFIDKLEDKNLRYKTVDLSLPFYNRYHQFYKVLKSVDPDVLHVNLPGPWSACFIPTIAKIYGINKVVTTEHLPMFGPSIKYTPIKLIDNYCTDKSVTVSYENVQYLERLHKIDKSKIIVVHNGIDVDKFNPEILKSGKIQAKKDFGFLCDDVVFGIVGRLTEQKGHIYAFQAIKLLKDDGVEVKVAVFGDGEKDIEYKKMIRQYDLEDNVRFLGFQSDMNKVYSSIDVLLMPSLFEALPLTLIEAMASGIPAIASEINGIPEVIDNDIDGVLIEPKNIDQIVNSIKEIMLDKSRVNELGGHARDKILKCFSLEKMTSETQSVYY